jgi:hypothetical protein
MSFADKLQPFLKDADRAVAENERLRQMVAQLQHELRYSQEMQDRAAEQIDAMQVELDSAHADVAMLKTRMKIFGDAASMILTDAPTGQLSGVVAQANEKRAQDRNSTIIPTSASEFLKRLQ